MSDWTRTCVLCAAHDRTTRIPVGHVCPTCSTRLADDLGRIVTLCCAAVASTDYARTGAGVRSVPGSKPPLRVEALDPENTPVPMHEGATSAPTVLEVVEGWERLIRDMRGLLPYGIASASRALVGHRYPEMAREGTAEARTGQGGWNDTGVSLTGCIAFLRSQGEWVATEPEFPIEDYASELAACVRVLGRWDTDRAGGQFTVPCPTLTETGTCDYRLRFGDGEDEIRCRRCGVSRDKRTLIAVGLTDGDAWIDPEAAVEFYGVAARTLRRWALAGKVQRSHGRYRASDVAAMLGAARDVAQ